MTQCIDSNDFSMFLEPATPHEVLAYICDLKNSNCGINSILVILLKFVKDIVCHPLCKLINVSFVTGVFPDCLKYASIVPIHKSGSTLVKDNYRPISILPVLDKIFERAMYVRLYKFFSDHSLLSDCQYGFRKHSSTSDALLKFTECVYDVLEAGNYALSIFVDFQKAFDTVNRKILLDKLSVYGVRGVCNSLFESYLTNRMQCVRVGSVSSEYCDCLLYTSPSPRDKRQSRMPSSA